MARDYAERARRFLTEAKNALTAEDYPTCVRRLQEALEMASKAVLRKLALEYPREHDVSEAMDAASDRFPDYMKEKLDDIKRMLTKLTADRGPALYGYELQGIPASEIFTQAYAQEAFSATQPLVELCIKFATEQSLPFGSS